MFMYRLTGMVGKRQLALLAILLLCASAFAQSTGAGAAALSSTTQEIAKYIPVVQKVIYAIAGVVAVVGCISVYIKMNNDEQDVKKSIMMLIGACIFLVSAATALPKFFGY